MKNPPKVIKTVMAEVCVMKDIKPEKIQDPDGSGKKVNLSLRLAIFLLWLTVSSTSDSRLLGT